jgi:hypothetical protein
MKDIPGFNADISLHETSEFYDLRAVWVDATDRQQEVVQQLQSGSQYFELTEPLIGSYQHCEEEFAFRVPGQGAEYCRTCCYWGSLLLYCGPLYRCG